jgi:hypothetical protein
MRREKNRRFFDFCVEDFSRNLLLLEVLLNLSDPAAEASPI